LPIGASTRIITSAGRGFLLFAAAGQEQRKAGCDGYNQ
jgi:hypothetical protein